VPALANMKATLVLLIGLQAAAGILPCAAQTAASDVAYVESVSGRVLAMVQGKPTLLDTLDMIDERTRLDLLANSELRLCHYRLQRMLTLKGPLRASVTATGVTAENGKELSASTETCARPAISNIQGGFIARTAAVTPTKVALRPTIKVVNKSTTNGIRDIALWDSGQQTIVASFERAAARPILNEGQSYVLVVGRNDGTEFKLILQATPQVEARTLIVIVR
jgi:hypothetical protein